MDHVVYVFGAGFSAPLGLPVMSNFLIKAKDMHRDAPDKYRTFAKVFDTIEEMSVCKSYFNTDLFNIEEILSILEMQERLAKGSKRRLIAQFIMDVINHYTPRPPERYPSRLPSNWEGFVFGNDHLSRAYGAFISALFNLRLEHTDDNPMELSYEPDPAARAQYSIISLNYDVVPENFCQFITSMYRARGERHISFTKDFSIPVQSHVVSVPLAKLHGCVGQDVIVAPTWNKRLDSRIMAAWEKAYELLRTANHIRIVGYSLPPSDAYIKYLFRASVLKAKHLKSLDVICLDPKGVIKSRYDEFIAFNFYRFANSDVLDFFKTLAEEAGKIIQRKLTFAILEKVHDDFMRERALA